MLKHHSLTEVMAQNTNKMAKHLGINLNRIMNDKFSGIEISSIYFFCHHYSIQDSKLQIPKPFKYRVSCALVKIGVCSNIVECTP